MARLPAVTGKQVVRALERAGFVKDRQKGSHAILILSSKKLRAIVPVHAGKTLKRPLLTAILSGAGLSEEEFRKLL